jgi:hypothetical protein
MLTYNVMHLLKTPSILNSEEKKYYGLQTFLLARIFQYICTYKITTENVLSACCCRTSI